MLRRALLQRALVLCGIGLTLWKLQIMQMEEEVNMRPRITISATDNVKEQFVFREDFSFPQPRVIKNLEHIKKSSWMKNIQHYLRSLRQDTKQIYLLTSNYKYLDVLLNWLISAVVRSNVTIENILTISMDYSTHSTLQAKGFPSVLVTPSGIFTPNFNFSAPFERVMMLRLSLMRIISHFGFNVAMIDTDAIMLRNPEPLFDAQEGMDIVGSMGTIPKDLMDEWPMTICIGVVLIRSSEKTEQFWNSMKDIHQECLDDQGKLNYGLKALNIEWFNSNSSRQDTMIYGKATNGLQLRRRYYFWHKGGHRSRRKKLQSAREGMTWFLKHKWDKIVNSLIGKDWLRSIAYLGVTVS